MAIRPIRSPQELLEEILSRLRKVTGPDSNGNYTALCPFHDDHNPSLSIHPERGFICFGCKEKGSLQKLAAKLGIFHRPIQSKRKSSGNAIGKIVATYDYLDEHGVLLYQVCRMEPKAFLQRRPDPSRENGWIWDLYGITPVPYRLPELLKAPQGLGYLSLRVRRTAMPWPSLVWWPPQIPGELGSGSLSSQSISKGEG